MTNIRINIIHLIFIISILHIIIHIHTSTYTSIMIVLIPIRNYY